MTIARDREASTSARARRVLLGGCALAVALLDGCKAERPAPVSIASAVTAELGRVEAAHKAIDPAALPEFARGALDETATVVERAGTATSPLLRLYRLRDASSAVGGLAYLAAHRAETTDLETLRALWEREGRGFDLASPRQGGPLVERALAQAARNRAAKLYRASLPYGKASGIDSGLYYLGEAIATLGFARFVESLPIDAAVIEPAPAESSVQAAIASLEDEILAAFGRDRSSGDAIYPSSLLKEARELANEGLLDAASLTLFEARLAVSRATKKPATPDTTMPEIPASAGEASLTSLFAGVARQRGPEIARHVVADVLPFHATLYEPAARVARREAPVTVTLVRWPYT